LKNSSDEFRLSDRQDAGTLVEANMSIASKVTREQIENLIKRINEIENARPYRTVEETVVDIGTLIATSAEGWVNGKRLPSIAAEREFERALFGLLDDYHRDIEHIVIDPPFVSFDWCMKSVKRDLEARGCSIIEADEAGLILHSWMYFDPAPFARIGLV
jgi:hypothetical protein